MEIETPRQQLMTNENKYPRTIWAQHMKSRKIGEKSYSDEENGQKSRNIGVTTAR